MDIAPSKPIDIYARGSELRRQQNNEPSTEGQVAVCRIRLADLSLPSVAWRTVLPALRPTGSGRRAIEVGQ